MSTSRKKPKKKSPPSFLPAGVLVLGHGTIHARRTGRDLLVCRNALLRVRWETRGVKANALPFVGSRVSFIARLRTLEGGRIFVLDRAVPIAVELSRMRKSISSWIRKRLVNPALANPDPEGQNTQSMGEND